MQVNVISKLTKPTPSNEKTAVLNEPSDDSLESGGEALTR